MEPALCLFVAAVLDEPSGDLQRRVEKKLPVVQRIRIVIVEIDVEPGRMVYQSYVRQTSGGAG